MEQNPKETLGDIARPKTPNNRGRKRSRTPQRLNSIVTSSLDEEKIKVVELLFENAKINLAKLEE